MAMHSFLRNFRRDGILPAKKQEHINSPDKIWPQKILWPIPHTKLMPGEQGTVQFIDDIGTIFVNWDCGSGLGVAYGEDIIRKI